MKLVFNVISIEDLLYLVAQDCVGRGKKLKRGTLMFGFILIALIVSPLFLVIWNFGIDEQQSEPNFFVGVEYAVDNHSVEDCKALVDRVKNFTNFFVVDSLGITLDIDNLNEVCDYVYDSGLYFMVFFISPLYRVGDYYVFRYNYYPNLWILKAKQKYCDKFLGGYVMDEPGGNQLDEGSFQLIKEAKDQAEAAERWIDMLKIHIDQYAFLRSYEDYIILTADYGLYWFDYKAGYDAILAEFGWNHSRPLHVALCRGAAKVQNRDWGVMVTWTYNGTPYIAPGNELYADLKVAYHNGAKYVIIFDHPDTDYSEYGILTEEHFDALENFWNYVNNNSDRHGTEKADVAYVLPENFGFGFRSSDDNIWGLWSANTDERTEKIWGDVNQLLDLYGSRLDIVYSDPEFDDNLQQHYDKIFFWNKPIN